MLLLLSAALLLCLACCCVGAGEGTAVLDGLTVSGVGAFLLLGVLLAVGLEPLTLSGRGGLGWGGGLGFAVAVGAALLAVAVPVAGRLRGGESGVAEGGVAEEGAAAVRGGRAEGEVGLRAGAGTLAGWCGGCCCGAAALLVLSTGVGTIGARGLCGEEVVEVGEAPGTFDD